MVDLYRDDDDDAGRSLIHRAARRGDVDTAARLLDADPSLIHDRNELNNEPLHEACWAKQLAMVRLLIRRGADVNARGDFGETPLHCAVRDDGAVSNAIVGELLQAGANIEARDERLRQNALGFALREFNDDLEPAIAMLRQRGSSVGLEGAMILGDVERVKEILSESQEELAVEFVRPVVRLAKECRRDDIAQLIENWLRHNASLK